MAEESTSTEGEKTNASEPETEKVSGEVAGPGFKKNSEYVPYARFKEVTERLHALEGHIASLNQRGQENSPKTEDAGNLDEFVKNPRAYIEAIAQGHLSQLSQTQAQQLAAMAQHEVAKTMVLNELRGLPDHSQELEDAMNDYINENGLRASNPRKLVELAYEGVTGKKFGATKTDGYSTRKLKDRLAAPGSRSGRKDGADLDALSKLSDDEIAKDPKGFYQKYMAAMAAEGQ